MDTAFSDTFQKLRNSKILRCSDLLLLMLTNQMREGWVIADLVQLSGFPANTITMAKTALLEQGLVEEHIPHRDLRTVKVYLTVAGQKKAAELWEAIRGLAEIEQAYRRSAPPARKTIG